MVCCAEELIEDQISMSTFLDMVWSAFSSSLCAEFACWRCRFMACVHHVACVYSDVCPSHVTAAASCKLAFSSSRAKASCSHNGPGSADHVT